LHEDQRVSVHKQSKDGSSGEIQNDSQGSIFIPLSGNLALSDAPLPTAKGDCREPFQ